MIKEQDSAPKKHSDHGEMVLEIQLDLAERYNMPAMDTALVFGNALADTIAYGLNETHDIDQVVDLLVPWLKKMVALKLIK